jgi:predicted GIY-YIG superfamily endonuclease
LDQLPNNKPVVYKILNNQRDNIYTGIAKRERVQNRLGEHLKGGPGFIPSASKVQIQQKASIAEA